MGNTKTNPKTTVQPKFNARICQSCGINHIENCPECFGFGHYFTSDPPEQDKAIPASYFTATQIRNGQAKNIIKSTQDCTVCGSGFSGI